MWAEDGVCGTVVTEELGKVAVGGPEGQAKEVGLCFVSNGMLALNFKMPAVKGNGVTHICLSLFYNAGFQDSHGSPLSPDTSSNRQRGDCWGILSRKSSRDPGRCHIPQTCLKARSEGITYTALC